jgi:very-short-patch-repair endonuclease
MTTSASPNPELGIDERIAALAATQHLCIGRDQAIALGASPALIQRRSRKRWWRRPHPGVYCLAPSPDPWLQRVWAARLAIGEPCTVSHATIAFLRGFSGNPRPDRLEFIGPHGSHPRIRGVLVHQIDDLRPHHVTREWPRCPGLPVTTAARTVVDLAVTASEARLRTIITEQVAANRLALDAVSLVLADVARPGKPGVARLARVLDALGGAPIPSSVAEAALFDLLRAFGLPFPERQVPLPGRGAVAGIVDGLFRSTRVIVEVDSRTWHGRFADLARDRIRDAEAARSGYLTLRLLYEHIRFDPKWVASTVSDVLADRAATLGVPCPIPARLRRAS